MRKLYRLTLSNGKCVWVVAKTSLQAEEHFLSRYSHHVEFCTAQVEIIEVFGREGEFKKMLLVAE